MKAQFLKVPVAPFSSFSVRKEMFANINNLWHYHTELELIQFHKHGGFQFVGDNISRFEAGDTVLVGSNLPHYWRFDETEDAALLKDIPYATVIHFLPDFLGKTLLELPEAWELKMVIEKAKRGLYYVEKSDPMMCKLMEDVYNSQGLKKIIALMDCLLLFFDNQKTKTLSSSGFIENFSTSENERISIIYNFTMNNFNRKIKLEEIAQLVNLEPNSFCRYFKIKTGKTYSLFLQEIKVGYACKLLIDNKLPLKQICFDAGFNNFSCFHKSFKLFTGFSPNAYRQAHILGN